MKKFESIFTIDKNNAKHIAKKSNMIAEFRDSFVDANINSNKIINGVPKKTTISAKQGNLIHRYSHAISRKDLILLLAEMSDDVKPLQTFLIDLLHQAVLDPLKQNPINKNDSMNRIWIDFAMGETPVQKDPITGIRVPIRHEVQLLITAVNNGKHPEDNDAGVVCMSTGILDLVEVVKPIEPPFTVPVHPQN